MKKPRHRVFDYSPRFYKPELDENERKKESLDFLRNRKNPEKKYYHFVDCANFIGYLPISKI